MTPHDAEQQTYQLPLVQFYAAINKERRAKLLMPVEPAVISVRTSVKFAILRRRTIKLQTARVAIDQDDLQALEDILAQLFDVTIQGGLISLCETGHSPSASNHGRDTHDSSHEAGIISRFVRRIKGERKRQNDYPLKINNLILAIINRRAYMGNKFMNPQTIREKCAQALHQELGIKMDMREPMLTVRGDQLDAFSEIIRREFQIMFDSLEELMEGKGKGKEKPYQVTQATRLDS